MLLWSYWNSWIINMSQSVLGKSMLLMVGIMRILLIIDQSNQMMISQVSHITKVDSCISGTWKIEERYGGREWQECDDGKKDVLIQFKGDSIVYDGLEVEGITYSCEFLAIKDKQEVFHGVRYEALGFEGDYFLKFYVHYANKEQAVCPFYNFVLISDKEIVIPDGRVMYKAVKMDEDRENTGNIVLERTALNGICYGLWEVTEAISGNGHIGEKIETSEKTGSFISGWVINSADSNISELVSILGKEEDTFIVCYEFSEDYEWDFMIIKDGMTAIVVKRGNLYWIERRSDPDKDGIYDELGIGERKYMYV